MVKHRILPADSEMARRIRDYDWATTSLGAQDSWPSALRVALNLALHSSFPTAIYWGPDLRLLYNDAWSSVPGERHPAILGLPAHEAWSDIWPVVGPQMLEVQKSGHGFSTYDQLLRMDRGDGPRDTYWNYSFTPILDDNGRTLGIFNQGNEVTERVLQDRRQQFLLRLSDDLRAQTDPVDIIRCAQRLLGEELDANRVGYGEVDSTERYFTTTDNWAKGVPSRHGTHDLAAFGPQIHGDLKHGVPLVVANVRLDPRTSAPAFVAAFEAIDTQAAITASLVNKERMVAALYVHSKAPREWSEIDFRLVQDVAERTWAELARAKAERSARLSDERYRRIFNQTSDLIITADLDQVITDCNESAATAVGLTREEAVGRRISEFISAEEFEKTSEMLRQKLADGGTTRYDVRVRSQSGELLFWEINSGLTSDESGRPVGLHVVGRDVTQRKRSEYHQRLLVAELNHRVKNTLAVVQSLAHQSFKDGRSADQAIKSFEGRLGTLASAHNLLTRENWDNAALREVLEQALAPFCQSGRCTISGPDVRITPSTAVSLSLAAHEMATNAVKYGALSNERGHVEIRWTIADNLVIDWREAGGPTVTGPAPVGFGTRMLQRALAADLQGQVTLDFDPLGLQCRISAPLEVVVSETKSLLSGEPSLRP